MVRWTAAVVVFVGCAFDPSDAASAAGGRLVEMQGQRQSGAMTPQRARRECWQAVGVQPGSPRNAYQARLLPQVESCIAQKMRR